MTDIDKPRALLKAADTPMCVVRNEHTGECEAHGPSGKIFGDGTSDYVTDPDVAAAVAAINALPGLLDELEVLRDLRNETECWCHCHYHDGRPEGWCAWCEANPAVVEGTAQ